MQRYILNNETKTFYDSDIHHIKNVMRMKSNDKVIVCLNGTCFKVTLDISNTVTFNILEEITNEATTNITLIQGLIKGSKIESTIKYGTIFGAKGFILTEFERSIVKHKDKDSKLDRYFNIAKEAAELSHREQIPMLSFSKSLKSINWQEFDVIILADEEEKTNNLKDIITKDLLKKRIAIVVGPEGGIANKEREYLKSLKTISVSLGKYIYPAEIASISLLNDLKS